MKAATSWIIASLVVSGACLQNRGHYLNPGWLGLLSVLLVFACLRLFRRDKLFCALALYTSFRAIHVAADKFNEFFPRNDMFKASITANAWFYLVAILLLPLALNLKQGLRIRILKFFAVLAVINSLWVILCAILNTPSPGFTAPAGVIEYPSLNGALIASCTPLFLLFKRKMMRVALLVPAIVAIFLCRSSVPFAVLIIVVGCYGVVALRRQPLLLMAIIALICGLGFLSEGKNFGNDAGRLNAYRFFFSDWRTHSNPWLGSGPGTFIQLAPTAQVEHGFSKMASGENRYYFWFWLHSDVLQLLYELGIVGLVLSAAVFVRSVLTHVRKKQVAQLGCLFGVMAAACINYPLRYAVFALLLFVLIPKPD